MKDTPHKTNPRDPRPSSWLSSIVNYAKRRISAVTSFIAAGLILGSTAQAQLDPTNLYGTTTTWVRSTVMCTGDIEHLVLNGTDYIIRSGALGIDVYTMNPTTGALTLSQNFLNHAGYVQGEMTTLTLNGVTYLYEANGNIANVYKFSGGTWSLVKEYQYSDINPAPGTDAGYVGSMNTYTVNGVSYIYTLMQYAGSAGNQFNRWQIDPATGLIIPSTQETTMVGNYIGTELQIVQTDAGWKMLTSIGSNYDKIRVWDMDATGKLTGTYTDIPVTAGAPPIVVTNAMLMQPPYIDANGNMIIAGGDQTGGQIIVFDPSTKTVVASISSPYVVGPVTFGKDGTNSNYLYISSTNDQGVSTIWTRTAVLDLSSYTLATSGTDTTSGYTGNPSFSCNNPPQYGSNTEMLVTTTAGNEFYVQQNACCSNNTDGWLATSATSLSSATQVLCSTFPTAPAISSPATLSNVCPATTVNLNTKVTSSTANLVWFTNDTHTGTAYSTPTTATAGTYYAFYYDSTNSCYSPASTAVTVTLINCNDTDGDTIPNGTDLDDDNDGILDTVECPPPSGSLVEYVGPSYYSFNSWVTPSSAPADPGTAWVAPGNYVFDNPNQVVDGSSTTYFHMLVGQYYGVNRCDWQGNTIALKYNFTASNYLTQFNIYNDVGDPADGIKNFTLEVYNSSNTLVTTLTGVGQAATTTQSFTLPSPITVASGWYYILRVSSQYCTGPATSAGLHWREMSFSGPSTPPSACDTDGDTIVDSLDLDSDNDGCSDAVEGGANIMASQLNANGSINTTTTGGVSSTGIPVLAGSGQTIGSSKNAAVNACSDSDGDTVPNQDDLDNDNDGILDTVEMACTTGNVSKTGVTVVKPSTINYTFNGTYTMQNLVDGTDNNTYVIYNPTGTLLNSPLIQFDFPTAKRLTSIEIGHYQNQQLFSNATKYKVQASNDGVTWVDVSSELTYNNTSKVQTTFNGNTATFAAPATGYTKYRLFGTTGVAAGNGWATEVYFTEQTCANSDTDGDTIPNQLDLDSDGDGCPDSIEGGGSITSSQLNTNGSINTSTTGGLSTSGVPILAGSGQTIGDSQNASVNACLDTDGDTIPNQDDLDDDNDGILDTAEGMCSTTFAPSYIAGSNVTVTPTTLAALSDTDVNPVTDLSQTYANFSSTNKIATFTFAAPQTLSKIVTYNSWGIRDVQPYKWVFRFYDSSNNLIATSPMQYDANWYPATPQTLTYTFAAIANVKSLQMEVLEYSVDRVVTTPEIRPMGDGGPYQNTVETREVDFFTGCVNLDTDGDTIPNYLDLDSDGDGCSDAIEGGASITASQLNANGSINTSTTGGLSTSGVPVLAGSGQTIGVSQDAYQNTCLGTGTTDDFDGDTLPNNVDLDDDNDGILDTAECVGYTTAPITSATAWQTVDNATTSGSEITLTANTQFQQGAAWYPGQIDVTKPFNYKFSAWLGSADGGADGIAFVLSADPRGTTAIGENGWGIGAYDTYTGDTCTTKYQNGGTGCRGGIYPSMIMEMDTYDNTANFGDSTAADHLSIAKNSDAGQVISGTYVGLTNIENGAWHPVEVNYDGSVLKVYFDGALKITLTTNISTTFLNGNTMAYIGYTASTGSNTNLQKIQPTSLTATTVGICDTDGDTIPNAFDLDSDGDGCFDAIEGGASITASQLNTNGSINTSTTGGVSSSGVPVLAGSGQTAGDSQNALVNSCPQPDTDGDTIPNNVDLDDDNDGIPDTVEAATALNGGDTDGDTIPDTLDLDSDGDGILDFVEARNLTPTQIATLDANGDGRLDGAVGTDGIPNIVQATGSENAGTINYTPLDTDGDGNPDFQDLDSDNDGINDVVEASPTGFNNDTNGDGKADGTVDANGVADMPNTTTLGLNPPDTDGDGKADFRDLDTDNDGIADVVEAGLSDPDNNGIIGTGASASVPDADGDGIADEADGNDGLYGDVGDTAPLNSDNDSVPNYRDLDSDNDSIADVIEGGNGTADTNGDGTISPTESADTDGDGIPQIVDQQPTGFGDAGNGTLPEGNDTDTIPDYIDTNSDNDTTPDIVEAGHGSLDPNGDGMIDNPTDPDGDGIPNNGTNDTKPTEFGGTTPPDSTDTDGDTIPNANDLDDDNDGILDTVEAATALNGGDTDGDTIPDTLDLDSDGDGILDIVESGSGTADANGDGKVDGNVGANGYLDTLETSVDSGTSTYIPVDTDGDGNPDFQDLDSDNDGINDVVEASPTGVNNDTNGDGKADGTVGTNGVADMPNTTTLGLNPPDTDGDSKPDFRDLDSDNDGINDVVEAGLSDPDNNGIIGTGASATLPDADNDGIADEADGNDSLFGDSGDTAPLNSDNDSVPNYRDLDSDNDTIADVIEGGNGTADTNGDGTISPTESPDTDGDGIPQAVDQQPSGFGDAGNGTLPEGNDTDTIPDYIDTNSDNDTIPDIVEAGHGSLDTTGDGMIDNPTDPDGDGIPNNGTNDTKPTEFGGTSGPVTTDTDLDTIPDATDLDDDNDGILDSDEGNGATDTDGDTVPDSLDLDSDGDGILDLTESGRTTGTDTNGDGRLDGAVGTDGVPDSVQSSPNAGTVNYTLSDFDGDGVKDFRDLDSDNDGINDVHEGSLTGVNNDTNGDGKADGTVDANGVASMPNTTTYGLTPPDTEGDGHPDFRDLESDGDGINDVRENGGADSDNNGIADGTDADGDGIVSSADGSPTWGDSADAAPANADNDTAPNYRDLDSDNDTISDVIEGGNAALDTDNNGFINSADTNGADTDGDGIPNSVDPQTGYGDAGSTLLPEQGGLDTDTIPDFLDVDSDGDGLFDIQEGTGNAIYDANGDGMVDSPGDTEVDGISNVGGIDGAPAAYGDLKAPDADADTIPDSTDLDDDNDGIPDLTEMATAGNGGDTDNDGILDSKDLDSDGDGILDVQESGRTTGVDADGDGRLDGTVGTDGIPDSVQSSPNAGTINYTISDFDGDSRPDFQDLDSDNDGINDVRETNGTDANGDGLADGTISPDGIASSVPAGGQPLVNTDGDAKPDFRDLDADNDGINDVLENGGTDSNLDGIADGTDTDGDGILATADGSPGVYGDSTDPTPINSDNDSVPNFRDLDSDNDTISDVIEGGNGPADTNNDGFISTLDTNGGDTDGDGIPNVLDNSPLYGDAGGVAPTEGPDADTTPDYIDVDSDGDGTEDICELTLNCPLDGNGDGMVDGPIVDPDTDGIPNPSGGIDGAPSGFGGLPAPTPPTDTDGDTIPNANDLDDDNDGILDTVEAATALNGGDTDGDTIPDTLDLDSDGDGILDIVESGSGTADTNGDGKVDGNVGSNGYLNTLETVADNGVSSYTVKDTDGDGNPDFQDLDSDNDGINDVVEASTTGVNNDTNGDGKADGTVGANGVADMPNTTTLGLNPPDTDGDGKADFRDLDSDNDGINDVVEAGLSDPDNNGIIGTGASATLPDADNDGIADEADGNDGAFGDSGDTAPLNSDNDTVPNYRDLDSDNDTIADVIEGGNGTADTNGDGTISPTESPDTDGDGIPQSVDQQPTGFGDAGNGALPEGNDADTIPDYIDTNSDNDTIPDIVEAGHGSLDTTGDGMVDNPTDPDGDGVPNNGGNDTKPTEFGGTTPPDTTDTDGDTIPNASDLDDDNDGILDTAEGNGTTDTDGDTVPDSLDLDSDNDGILDLTESGQTSGVDLNDDGRLDGPVGTDGVPDSVQTSPNSGTVNYTIVDTDGDGVKDFRDLDSDNDGINDVVEASPTGTNNDTNGDGMIDTPVAGGLTPPDTDGDFLPDFRDLDSDNDGINDVRENGGTDANNDGLADGTDTDGDGIRSSADPNPAWGDSGSSTPANGDNDAVPNYRDLDSDNDSISDLIEGGTPVTADTNNDGIVDGADVDGDGIRDVVDTDDGVFGEGSAPGDGQLPNTDGTDLPDYLDTDSDNDGTKDIVEVGKGTLDGNGDGMIDNPTDPDGDGIPNNGGNDTLPSTFGGVAQPASGCKVCFTKNASGGKDLILDISGVGVASYTLQGHTDLSVSPSSWATLSMTPTVSGGPNGATRYTWSNVDSNVYFSGSTTDLGFVRVRCVRADGTSDVTETFGWDKHLFEPALETWQHPWLKCCTFRGVVTSGGATLNVGADVKSSFIAGKNYYVEVESGAYEGQRFEVNESSSTAASLTIDSSNVLNTMGSVPSLAGATVCVREHWTMDEVFDKTKFHGTLDPQTADRVIVFNSTADNTNRRYITYWLADNGNMKLWVREDDAQTADQGARILPPGEGYLVHARGGPVNLNPCGLVRQNAFAAPYVQGVNLVGSGYPIDLSPNGLDTFVTDGFLYTLDPQTADRISLWNGDVTVGATNYTSYVYLGTSSANDQWTRENDAQTANQNATKLYKADRAYFLNARGPRLNHVRPLPWAP